MSRARAAASLTLAVIAASAAWASDPSPRLGIGATPSDAGVTEAEWARELARALGLDAVLPPDADDEDVFTLLCAARVARATEAGGRGVPTSALRASAEPPRRRDPSEPVRVVLNVPYTALYQLTVTGEGLQRWNVDGHTVGHLDLSPLGVAQTPTVLPLRTGPHELTAHLPRRAHVERVEISGIQRLCIAPAEGWSAKRPLTHGAMARTLSRSLGLERHLPASDDAALEIEGEAFETASGFGAHTNQPIEPAASERRWATAVDGPAEFRWRLRLEEPGVYTLSARVHGGDPQIWSIDGRHRVTVRPGRAARAGGRVHVLTLPLPAGEHIVRALVARGAGIDSLRLTPRRARANDYLAVTERAGFPAAAADTPVSRSVALESVFHPTFTALAEGFTTRVAGDAREEPAPLFDPEPPRRWSRPLGPVLPAGL